MQRSLTFKLYPNARQAAQLARQLEACRRLYNACLQQRRIAYAGGHRTPKEFDQNRQLVEVRNALPDYAEVPAGVLQAVPKRLNRAYANFFAGRARFPRFKGRARYDSIQHLAPMEPHGHGTYRFEPRRLYLTRVGHVKHRLKRTPAWYLGACVPKTLTLKRVAGTWCARVTFQIPDNATRKPTAHAETAVGLDAGLHHLIATSDGTLVENPRWLTPCLKKLRREQRRLSRRARGSNNRTKQVQRVARIHQRIANRRLDHHHKLTTTLATSYRVVAVEDHLTGLRGTRLARSVHDAAWGRLYRLLDYKLQERGGRLVRVDPRGTSQTCSACGSYHRHELHQRTYRCANCGLVLDRDVNAARNILQRARTQLPRDTGKVTPGETGSPSTSPPLAEVLVVEPGTSRTGFLNPA